MRKEVFWRYNGGDEFMDATSPVFFYPVGYSNLGQYHFLWKPGISPKQEFARSMERYKRDTQKPFWSLGKVVTDVEETYWQQDSLGLMRLPRGDEARQLVEMLRIIHRGINPT